MLALPATLRAEHLREKITSRSHMWSDQDSECDGLAREWVLVHVGLPVVANCTLDTHSSSVGPLLFLTFTCARMFALAPLELLAKFITQPFVALGAARVPRKFFCEEAGPRD